MSDCIACLQLPQKLLSGSCENLAKFLERSEHIVSLVMGTGAQAELTWFLFVGILKNRVQAELERMEKDVGFDRFLIQYGFGHN